MGKQWKQCQTLFLGAPKSLKIVTATMKLKDTYSLEGKLWPTYIAYSKAETLLWQQSPSSQGYGFSSGHVWMWELDCEESWALKNWCLWTVVLEKTLESPLDCKEIQPVHPKGNQSWIFIGRTDAEAERGKSWLKTQHSENLDHGIWSHHFMANRWGNNGNSDRLDFLRLQNHCKWWLQPWN